VSLTIVLGACSVALTIAMLVGWTLVIWQNRAFTKQVSSNTWLMVGGITSLVIIIAVLVWFSIFLVREIREGRRQTTFIDSVTHELKSPLASLKLCLETLGREQISPEQREQIREMMMADADRLSVFIEDILVATRVASRAFFQRHGHVLEDVNVREMFERCRTAMQGRYRIEADAITISCPEGLHLETDGTAFETVVKNLLDNAVKYSDPPVRVQLRAALEGERVRIEVEDGGIGISQSHIKRVFDRFYRAPGEAVQSRRGTGLGLFVVSGLVRDLGGRMQVHSEGLGKGTCMRVWMPGPRRIAEAA
jgi:signal transduction histidine kinase